MNTTLEQHQNDMANNAINQIVEAGVDLEAIDTILLADSIVQNIDWQGDFDDAMKQVLGKVAYLVYVLSVRTDVIPSAITTNLDGLVKQMMAKDLAEDSNASTHQA